MLKSRYKEQGSNQVKATMKYDKLQNLRTDTIVVYKDIYAAYKLTRNYCYIPMTRKQIKKTITSDLWSSGELLSDVFVNPKTGDKKRDHVALLLLSESSNKEEKSIIVTCFAVTPWYNVEVATHWADYRINKAMSNDLEFTNVSWLVDEFNDELLLYLRDLEYKATGYVDTNLKVGRDTETYRKVILKK